VPHSIPVVNVARCRGSHAGGLVWFILSCLTRRHCGYATIQTVRTFYIFGLLPHLSCILSSLPVPVSCGWLRVCGREGGLLVISGTGWNLLLYILRLRRQVSSYGALLAHAARRAAAILQPGFGCLIHYGIAVWFSCLLSINLLVRDYC